MKYLSIIVLAFFLIGNTANAQFLKKLKKKIEEKVENTITENVSNKAASEADKSLNKMWEMNMPENMNFGMSKVDYTEIPDSYKFSWKYDMKIETEDGTTDLVYLFEEDSSYLGILFNQDTNKMIIVYDPVDNLNIMYMDNDNSKMVMASKISLEEDVDEMTDYNTMEITEIGNKEIAGYDCSGFRMENEQYIIVSYITEETNLNFANMFQSKGNPRIPKSVDAEWFKKYSDGLMLEMTMTDKENNKGNVKMYCTSLSKENFKINKSDYQGI